MGIDSDDKIQEKQSISQKHRHIKYEVHNNVSKSVINTCQPVKSKFQQEIRLSSKFNTRHLSAYHPREQKVCDKSSLMAKSPHFQNASTGRIKVAPTAGVIGKSKSEERCRRDINKAKATKIINNKSLECKEEKRLCNKSALQKINNYDLTSITQKNEHGDKFNKLENESKQTPNNSMSIDKIIRQTLKKEIENNKRK